MINICPNIPKRHTLMDPIKYYIFFSSEDTENTHIRNNIRDISISNMTTQEILKFKYFLTFYRNMSHHFIY